MSINNPKWVPLKTSGGILEARKYHASTLVAKTFIVHGGINYKGTCLSDIWGLDTQTLKWQ